MLRFAELARHRAASAGFYKGRADAEGMAIVTQCRHVFPHHGNRSAAVLIFTRDEWHHNCGWWKNPDYERCEHLSLSFLDMETGAALQQDNRRAHAWCRAFFGDRARMLWVEPPAYQEGRSRDVFHYRLFMQPDWRTPLLPRGEVYTREFTQAGWKSFSELMGGMAQMDRNDNG